MATSTPTVRFSIGQYDLMIEAGVFVASRASETREGMPPQVELIDGEIVMMSPIGSRHEEIVDRLNAWSHQTIHRDVARIRIQQSIGVPGRQSVPQPDVAWVRPRNYAAKRPDAADATLLIEVAETSLAYDLGEKADIYAAGGVPEYWVVDVAAEVVHVFRMPGPRGYVEHHVAPRGETIAPRAHADAGLAVDSLFAARP